MAAAAVDRQVVESLLETRRPEGFGDAGIIADVTADLNADEVIDEIILYSYQIGSSRDGNHWQYLVAFLSSPTGHSPTESLLVGGKGRELWDKIEVVSDGIRLEGRHWRLDDAMCCPGEIAEMVIELHDGKFIALGGRWRKQ
jgi:hypothetical protein